MGALNSLVQNFSFIILASLTLFILVLFAWNIFLQLKLSELSKRNIEFFADSKVSNLEELILSHAKTLRTLDKDIQELFDISNQINRLALRGIHKTGLVRYNPFKDVGGDQSFAIALLDGKNNGLVLSSLFTREGARIYSKSILNGNSEKYPLTQEEKQAIDIAMSEKAQI